MVWCRGGLLWRWCSSELVVAVLDLQTFKARRGARARLASIGSVAADLVVGTQAWAAVVVLVSVADEDDCGKVE